MLYFITILITDICLFSQFVFTQKQTYFLCAPIGRDNRCVNVPSYFSFRFWFFFKIFPYVYKDRAFRFTRTTSRNELSLGKMFDYLSLFNKCEYLYFIQQHSIPLDKKRINPDEVRKHFLKSCNCKQNKMDKKILCFDSDLKNLR